MDKAEALAYVSRLFDAAQAGAVLWGDKLLLKRFLEQCSRTGSQETKDGYRRELRHFTRWRDQNHPHLHLRELDPALVQDWVSLLREQVEASELMPRSFNRRISAVSALYRWASEPTRSAVTGVPRNPIPRRTGMSAPKLAKPLAESDLTSVLGVISAAKVKGSAIAARDYVMVRGSYLLGCRVSELCGLRWEDIEPLDEGGNVRLLGKGSKPRTICLTNPLRHKPQSCWRFFLASRVQALMLGLAPMILSSASFGLTRNRQRQETHSWIGSCDNHTPISLYSLITKAG